MGKKFRNRFRGLCPCTKTSPTPEVEDGGKMDNGRKVGVQEKQPNHPVIKTKPQQLSKFDQMIVEVEAMYANLIEKLDHRHKSLNEFTKVIFGGNFSLNTTIQVNGSVQTDQPKPNTILTRGEQENGYSNCINQPNINIGHFEEKLKDNTHTVRKPLERNAISDAILYRWMTKRMEVSDDNKIKTEQSSVQAANKEHIKDDTAKHDEVKEVIYFIDRVFIVDPRISHVNKMMKLSKTDLKSIGLKNAKGESPFRMEIVNISDIAMVHKADTSCITADTFVSPHIRAQPIIFDLHKVYGIVAERNQVLGSFPTSQQVGKMKSYYPSPIIVALGYIGASIQQLQRSGLNRQMHFTLDFSLRAATGLQVQVFLHKQVVKVLVAFSQFSPIDQQALVPGHRHSIQISTVFGQLTPICLQALMTLISVAFGKVVPTDLSIQSTQEFRLGQMPLALGYPGQTSLQVRKSGKDPLRLISLALDFPTKTILRLKTTTINEVGHHAMTLNLAKTRLQTGKYPAGPIALAFDFPKEIDLKAKKSRKDTLGYTALAHDYPVKHSLRAKTTGKNPLQQIALALFPDKINLRAKEPEKEPLGQIAVAFDLPTKSDLKVKKTGQYTLGQIAKTRLRTWQAGNDHLELIALAFGIFTLTNHQAKNIGYEKFQQIFVAIGQFVSLTQFDKTYETEHMLQVCLPFDKCSSNLHRVQKVREEPLRQMFLALGTMVTASFQDWKYGNHNHRMISGFSHQPPTGLPARTTRNASLVQLFVAFGNQSSNMELGLKNVIIVVDKSLLSRHSALQRSALKGQKIHTPGITEHFPSLTSLIHLADLKEEINIFSNYGSCRAILAIGMLTGSWMLQSTKTAVTDSICLRMTNAKDETESLEMKTAQPILDMFGSSHKIAVCAGLGITKKQITVGPPPDRNGSVNPFAQSDNIKVLERISTPEPKADTVRVYRSFSKPVIIKETKGKPTVEQVNGVFGICHTNEVSAGLKAVVRRTSDKQNIRMLIQSRHIVRPNNYLKWEAPAQLMPDRLGLCRAADLIARENEHKEKSTDINACRKKTPIISARTVSVGSSTEDEIDLNTRETARADDESKDTDCFKGESKSHIQADFPEGSTDCGIAKTNSLTSHRGTQDKSTDTADLPRPNALAPVVAKDPVPGSSFGRFVLKHEVKGNLQDLMDKGVPLDESHARFMCINLLDILKYLHTRGVIHTNICPSNIFFDEFGYPCLTGYDKCIYIGSDPQTRRKFRPPIEYCSPEQAMKTYVTEATDVFSVGVLCFNMIYGRPPHQGKTYKETRDNITNNLFIPKFEPDGLLSRSGKFFLVSCIRKDIDKRFNVRNCGQSLVRSVKWFNEYDEKALLSHNMTSPFLQLLEN